LCLSKSSAAFCKLCSLLAKPSIKLAKGIIEMAHSKAKLLTLSATAVTAALLAWQNAEACSRILWNDNKLAVFVARSMDWPQTTEPVLTVFPRGIARNGGRFLKQNIVKENPAKWVSKYGSMITSVYGVGTADGFNERGLGIHLLYLRAADLGPRDSSKPGIQMTIFGQYLLDNAATVQEAVALVGKVQPVMVELHGFKSTVHFAIEDASGDSAIIEHLNGRPVVHHGRQYQIMTNDPTYDEQLALLKKQDFSKPSMDLPIPGNVNAVDRFQRAAYYKAVLKEPKSERQAVASMFAIARNVSVPFDAPYHNFGVYNTEYRTVMNLTNKRYYFELTDQPNVIWAYLDEFDLRKGAPVMVLDPHNPTLWGDISGRFRRAKKVPF
jgi:penicillin V acylase-like amidase (Ntn superfamily)